MSMECPHLKKHIAFTTEKRKRNKVLSCDVCTYTGPNLWICLHHKCMHVGCSEQQRDHSTIHFKVNKLHCVHMNISSERIWCFLCESEVFMDMKETSLIMKDCFELSDQSDNSEHSSHLSDDVDNVVRQQTQGLVGLQNLANTCYMNSALQALSNVQPLTYYFLNCADFIENNIEMGSCPTKLKLARNYSRFIKDIWSTKPRNKDFIAPRGILCGIRNAHPIFRGFQQHDTQEFLRCFMDQLHEELKELKPKIPKSEYTNDINRTDSDTFNVQHQQLIEDDADIFVSSQSDSTSHSEAEYETCDSGVSEQSSLFDDICRRDKIQGESVLFQKQRNNEFKQNPSINQSHRSIISDVFDGKLLSSVQCLTCDRVSTKEETFQDLSLPIPNRDCLNFLRLQNHFVQSVNPFSYGPRTAGSVGRDIIKSDDWLTWMWKIIRSWLWGPTITLHDCMSSFFSADELKGDNMYSCEKCNKLRTGIKFSRILELPEVLCIHLKRFRHDLSHSSKISSYINFPLEFFDMNPYLHKDCKSKVSLYNLVSVICHYGTVCGGHYTCFAKNEFTKKWYEFDDQNITEVSTDTVRSCQAYVLFYCKYNQQMDLIRAEARDISSSDPVHRSDIKFYISREWLIRFNTFAEPGLINNWAILCPHGGLPPNKLHHLNEIVVPISQQLWDYLYKKFGGGPVINMLFECDLCKKAADILARRQNYELAIFSKYNDLEHSNAIYAISMPWLRQWQQFARGFTEKDPGPITNVNISAHSDDYLPPAIRNVKIGSDYAQISEYVWRFLHAIYGGGPEILLREIIYAELSSNQGEDGSNNDKPKATLDAKDNMNASEHRSKYTFPSEAVNQNIKSKSLKMRDFNFHKDESQTNMDNINSKHSTKGDLKPYKNFSVINKKNLFDHGASKFRTKRKRVVSKNIALHFGQNVKKIIKK